MTVLAINKLASGVESPSAAKANQIVLVPAIVPAVNLEQSIALLANSATTQSADRVEVQKLMGQVEGATNLESSYSVSIPLLGATYLNDRASYQKWEKAIYTAFQITPESSEEEIVAKLKENASVNAWVLGRLLVANLRMGDAKSAQKIATVIEKLLEQSSVDPFAAWAWGYLAIFYAQVKPNEYDRVKEKMLACTDALIEQKGETGKDNVHWAIVMELQSLAEMNESELIKTRLQALMDFSGTTSIVDALESIPPGDFRAWATALILSAAKKVKNDELVSSLESYFPATITASPSDGDKMLALLIHSQ